MEPILQAIDRSISVPPGHIIKSGYVEIHRVQMACRDRMAVGDVGVAYQKLLQMGGHQPHPSPNGYWNDDWFVIQDGRHQYVASLMLGHTHLLVTWLEKI